MPLSTPLRVESQSPLVLRDLLVCSVSAFVKGELNSFSIILQKERERAEDRSVKRGAERPDRKQERRGEGERRGGEMKREGEKVREGRSEMYIE